MDLTAMSAAYFVALLILFGTLSVAVYLASSEQDGAQFVVAIVAVLVVYVVLGGALCAIFLRRLTWWNDASLEDAVKAKMNFLWTWPWAAGRLLTLLLLFHVFA